MARLLLFDGNKFTELNIDADNLDEFYKYLECDCFDIAHRKVGSTYYDIFCDDVGLFKENNPITAISAEHGGSVMLVGNLIFANHNEIGETTSLSDEDIKNIKSHLSMGIAMPTGRIFKAVICEY